MIPLEKISGPGIGLRRSFLEDLEPAGFFPGWVEITPENWIHMLDADRGIFENIMSRFPVAAHGVSLSLGSPGNPDFEFLGDLKKFLDKYNISVYSEHLSFSNFNGIQSYELFPLPMTPKMVSFLVNKIKIIEDVLERPLIIENPSYYYRPYSELEEWDFINSVLEKSGCRLLLDVNNVYVNSVNHSFNPENFIDSLNLEKTAYIHIAGHTFFPEDNLIIDTHGENTCSEVWDLLRYTLEKIHRPVLIERDNNIPELKEILKEYQILEGVMNESIREPEGIFTGGRHEDP